jgi:hypothetical protein
MKRIPCCLLSIILLLLVACSFRNERLKVDVSDINIPEIKIHRFDLDLFSIQMENLESGLQGLKNRYYFFLGTDLSDQGKLIEMRTYLMNPRNSDLHRAVKKSYQDVSGLEKELTGLFKHYRYYFPNARIPRVYSYISGGDYENPVQLADSVLLLGFDNYLGKTYQPYFADGLPLYKAERMSRENIIPDVAKEIARSLFQPDPSSMTLLDRMIEMGKQVYIAEAFIPDISGHLLLDYPPEKFEWIKKNESHVWATIIENRMLFSSSGEVMRLFLADGPCSTDFSKESPPRIGEWIGWQIVKAYMQKNPDITLHELISEKDSQKILTGSAYKPEK